MKKFSIFFSAALSCAILLSSCEKREDTSPNPPPATSTLCISLEGIDAYVSTRASTAENNSDKSAQSTRIYIFEPGGTCIEQLNAGGSVSLPRGYKYTVAALVNGPLLSKPSLSALRSSSISLKDYPYVMYKETQADLGSAATVSVNLKVASLAARVKVAEITNGLPSWLGNLSLEKIFLCNVVGSAKPDGSVQQISLNWYGRSKLATPVTNDSVTGSVDNTVPAAASTLDETKLTLASGQGISAKDHACWFYCFPNPNKKAIPAGGITGSAEDQTVATWLTICGKVKEKTYYWTINLGEKISVTTGLAANYSYDIRITLNNLGSSNPSVPVVPGSASISISIEPWKNGGDISATI